MKRSLPLIILLIFWVSFGYAQTRRLETLESITAEIGGNGQPQQVMGSSGILLTQGDATMPTNGTSANTINGSNAIVLKNNQGKKGWIEIPLDHGIETLTFYCTRAFSDNSQIKVTVAGISKTKSNIDNSVRIFSNSNLNFKEPTTLRIELWSGGACVIDSIHWTEPNIINVDVSQTQWRVSDYLVGMHSVYNYDSDAGLASAAYDKWLKDAKINIMRYPGGTTVKYWDWENPTGVLTGDPWDPNWDVAENEPEEKWRSLDEYLTTLDATGMTGLFGVNITSGYVYGRVQESIDRAVRMVQYAKDRGHGGSFWYLGNEGGNGGLESEANLFVQHASAMKAVDPDINCMFNQNDLTESYLKDYLAIAGDYVDYAETHGKWPYGGDPAEFAPGTYEEWQVEMPVRDRKNRNRAWRHEANNLRKWAAEAGYPNLKFANNEYGTGKGSNVLNFDRYTSSLLIIDVLQEHFIGNWDMACYWSTIRNGDEIAVLSKANNYEYNPVHYGFEMLARAQGSQMIGELSTGNPSVYGFIVTKESRYIAYIINKSEYATDVLLNLENDERQLVPAYNETLRNTSDSFGEIVNTSIEGLGSNSFQINLEPLSYNMVMIREGNSSSARAIESSLIGEQTETINFYPNPTTGMVKISSPTGNELMRFKLHSLDGKIIHQGIPKGEVIDLSHISIGTYILNGFMDDGRVINQKIVVE